MADANPSDGGFQELSLAIIADDTAAVENAIASGADVNARDEAWGSTALIFASLLGRAEIARLLIAAGADIHATDRQGTNALTLAELGWETTDAIATMQQIRLADQEAVEKGKAEIAEMLRQGS